MATPARAHLHTGYFFQQIASAERSTLVLDFDTTLRGATPRPRSFPLPSVEELLACLSMARGTRLIVTSKHDAKDVLSRFQPPYPEVWAQHGPECMSAAPKGAVTIPFGAHLCPPSGNLDKLLAILSASGPVAYLSGAPNVNSTGRILVRPQLHFDNGQMEVGCDQDLVQFLVDWLRACPGDIC